MATDTTNRDESRRDEEESTRSFSLREILLEILLSQKSIQFLIAEMVESLKDQQEEKNEYL